jgi:hypothetical protein
MPTTTLDVEGADYNTALLAWAAANPSAAADLVTALGGALPSALSDLDAQRIITDATDDVLLTDFAKTLIVEHATPVLTVQPAVTIAYASLFNCELIGDNNFQVVGGAGVTINDAVAETFNVAAIPGGATLIRKASNVFYLIGSVTVAP